MTCYPCQNAIPHCYYCYNSTICKYCDYPYALNDNYKCVICDYHSKYIHKKNLTFSYFFYFKKLNKNIFFIKNLIFYLI